MNEIMAHHTEKSVEQISSDTERDFFMTPADAVSYGIIDKVQEPRSAALASVK